MAKLSALIPALANVLDIPQKTVAIHARHLREARLISTGGRGPGGAEMSPWDCANLLIAIMGADYAKDAAKVVAKYRQIVAGREWVKWRLSKMPVPALINLPEHHEFAEALEALITSAMDGSLETALKTSSKNFKEARFSLPPSLEVALRSPFPVAHITISASEWTEGVTYAGPHPWLRANSPPEQEIEQWKREIESNEPLGDLEQGRKVSARTVLALGKFLRG